MKLSRVEIALISEIANEQAIDGDVIIRLLQLEEDFPDVYAWGARANLKRMVARILEQAANQANLDN